MSNVLYNAIKKSVYGSFSLYIIQFICLAIYSRIFTPEEFGVVASIQVFVIFFQMLTDIGVGPALINKKEISIRDRDGIYSFTLILGLVIALLFYFFSFYLNYYYGKDYYSNYSVYLSMAIVFQCLSILPMVAHQRETKFLTIAKLNIFCELFTLCCVILFYYLGFGVFSMILRVLFQSIAKYFSFLLSSRKTILGKPSFGKNIFYFKEIYKFSSFQFSFNFINYFSRNLDNILIGRYLGMSILGVYDKSYQLMRYPLQIITFSMTPAILPVLSKYKNDIEFIKKQHENLVSKLLLVSIPVSIFFYFNAADLVFFLFGNQWGAVIGIIKIFSFVIPVQVVLSASGSFFQVIERTDLLFYSGFFAAILNVTGIITGVYFRDLNIIALFLCITFSINFIQIHYILFSFGYCLSINNFWKVIIFSLLKYIPMFICYMYYIEELFLIINTGYEFVNLVINFVVCIIMVVFTNFNKIKVFINNKVLIKTTG